MNCLPIGLYLQRVEILLIENLCHLGIDAAELFIVAGGGGGVGMVDGMLVAFEGHGGIALLMVGTAEEIVGQQLVVMDGVGREEGEKGFGLFVEEVDVWTDVVRSEGLVGAVEHVDAVEAGALLPAFSLGGAAKQDCQQENA